MSAGPGLDEVLATGRGLERSFNHDPTLHSHPTASVNTIKNVWVCYSCHAKGAVDSTRVPSVDELEAMLEPEKAARRYPVSWLSTFGVGGYWSTRFPQWLCWYLGMGENPWTGEGTYPVHTAAGTLAGVCTRALTDGPWPKYKYPKDWAASRALGGTMGSWQHHDVVFIGEGYADAAAGWEIGCPSVCTYGSSLHEPQIELIARMTPKVILLGHDNDDAGNRGAAITTQMLEPIGECIRVNWKEHNDPASVPVEERRSIIESSLGLGLCHEAVDRWPDTIAAIKAAHQEETQ